MGGFSLVLLMAVVLVAEPLRVWELIETSAKGPLMFAAALGLLASLLRALKWNALLGLDIRTVYPVQMVGVTLGTLSPGNVAEPLKLWLLKAHGGMPVTASLPTLILERLVELMVIIALAGSVWGGSGVFWGTLALAALVTLGSRRWRRRLGKELVAWGWLTRRVPAAPRVLAALLSYRPRWTALGWATVLTLGLWWVEGLILWGALQAVGEGLSPWFLAGVLASGVLIGALSAMPGGLGSFEATVVAILTAVVDDMAVATAAVLLYRTLSFGLSALLGALALGHLSRRYRWSFRAAPGAPEPQCHGPL